MKTEEIKALNDAHIINTYGARKLALVRGEGMHLWDADGRQYLDFFAGIAVCNLGHCHPVVTEAICRQAATLVHVSNLYYIEPQVKLAALLCEHCFAERWFFCNSGAEANEGAIKLARRYWAQQGAPKPNIISMQDSFHGRTMATITATGQPKYHQGFEPMLPGFTYVPFNDVAAVEAAITPETGAVLVEAIQGEGGVRVPADNYLLELRDLCNRKQVLLIIDEVQTGMGRTGRLFAHQHAGVTPDIMTLAKGLANGVPIGAVGCTGEVASGFAPGSHAATFGGNPLSTAAGLATLECVTEPDFIERAMKVGEGFRAGLEELARAHPRIVEVRGKGLMLGVEFEEAVAPVVAAMLDKGVICGPAGPNVLRFLPPLIVTANETAQVCDTLENVLGELGW